jgi:hypothetical protein
MEKYLQVNDSQILDMSHDKNMDNLVIIDKSILRRLVHSLTTAPFRDIRHGLIERIMECKTIEELLNETASFNQFYSVVNYVKEEQQQELESCNKVMDYGNELGEL